MNARLRVSGSFPRECSTLCADALQLYRDGLSFVQVSGQLHVKMITLYAHVRRYHPEIVRRRYEGPRQWREALPALIADGLTASEIGERLGISRERVRQIAAAAGLPRFPRSRRHHTCTPACAAVLAAESRPLRIRPLALATGIPEGPLSRAARRHAIETSTQRGQPHRCDDRCARFPEALVEAGSIKAAERLMGVGKGWSNHLRVHHPTWPWPDPRWWLRRSTNGQVEAGRR